MTQIFLQSELLSDVEVIELDEGASKHDLRQACLARVGGHHLSEALILFIEDEDDEDAIDKLDSGATQFPVDENRFRYETVVNVTTS